MNIPKRASRHQRIRWSRSALLSGVATLPAKLVCARQANGVTRSAREQRQITEAVRICLISSVLLLNSEQEKAAELPNVYSTERKISSAPEESNVQRQHQDMALLRSALDRRSNSINIWSLRDCVTRGPPLIL